jgi:hypothetical protein
MKFIDFIHNDDVKCYVAIQRTHKLVEMGCINFENHVLSKRWWACKKMNVACKTFKDEKKGNHWK